MARDSLEEPPETQYISDPDDPSDLYEVQEILDERGSKGVGDYLVQWSGNNPETGKPWEPSWAAKKGCTQGLIDEWKAKKKANPEIVGVEGRKLKEREAQKQPPTEVRVKKEKTTKRKREGKGRKGATKKPKVASTTHSPASESRASSFTPSDGSDIRRRAATRQTTIGSTTASISPRNFKKSPDSRNAGPSAIARRRTTTAMTASKSASVEPQAPPPQLSSPFAARPTPPPARRGGRRVIPLTSPRPIAGPGPTTIENRAKEAASTPRRTDTGDGDGSAISRTATTRSAFDSQVDPISQFSSPLRVAGKRRDDGPANGPTNTQTAAEGTQPQTTQAEESEIQGPSIEVEVDPTKFERRIIDGEEVLICIEESNDDPEDEDDEDDEEGREGRDGQEVAAAIEVDDADLDGLSTGSIQSTPAGQPCRWDGCTRTFESASELAAHLRTHAGSFESIITPTENNDTRATEAAIGRDRQSSEAGPSNSSSELAELQKEVEKLRQRPTLDEVEGIRAQVKSLQTQIETDDADKLRADLKSLHTKLEEVEPLRAEVNRLKSQTEADDATKLRADNAELKQQLEEMRPVRMRVSELTKQLGDLGTLRAENTRLKAQIESDDVGQLRADNASLQKQLEEMKSVRIRVNDLTKQLEELAALRAEVATLRPQVQEADSFRKQVTDLQRQVNETSSDDKVRELEDQIRALQSSRRTSVEEATFLRAQWAEARDRAVEEVQIGNSLREKIKTLKGQLSLGLKQRDLHRDTIHQKREEETTKLRAQNKILQDQARLTDDVVRRKAAMYPEVKAKNDELEVAVSELQDRVKVLEDRNNDLLTQVTEMRARQMGLLDDDGESEDEFETDSDSDSRSGGGSPLASQAQLRLNAGQNSKRPIRALSAGRSNVSAATREREAREAEEVDASVDNDLHPLSLHDERPFPAALNERAYRCKWVTGESGQCCAVFDSFEEMAEHAGLHQRVDIELGHGPINQVPDLGLGSTPLHLASTTV